MPACTPAVLKVLLILLLAGCRALPLTETGDPEYDLLIKNGRVLDGTGNPWYFTDIAIKDDRIAEMGDLENIAAKRTVDAAGLYVAPGFIDVHSHAAGGLSDEKLSAARPLLTQGITTVILNPDGGGAVDLNEQKKGLLEHGLGVNTARFIPHGSIRGHVVGKDHRRPTPEEHKNEDEQDMGMESQPAKHVVTTGQIVIQRADHVFRHR